MDQAKRLKWGSIGFSIFWVAAMIWWSGEYHPANIIILSVCGAAAGYFWYRAMTWSFRRMRLLPDASGANR
jgi:uncharacterized membrane protein